MKISREFHLHKQATHLQLECFYVTEVLAEFHFQVLAIIILDGMKMAIVSSYHLTDVNSDFF